MLFRIVRDRLDTGRPTTGQLFAGDLSLFTLEPPWDNNSTGTSCIPTGVYRCVIAWSNRYKRLMPRLLGVRGRDGILIHSGNTTLDTHGCILLGLSPGPEDTVRDSRAAFGLFFEWLGVASRDGDVFCNITYEDYGKDARVFQTT